MSNVDVSKTAKTPLQKYQCIICGQRPMGQLELVEAGTDLTRIRNCCNPPYNAEYSSFAIRLAFPKCDHNVFTCDIWKEC